MTAILTAAKSGTTPTEDSMAITDAEWKKLEALIKAASFTGVVATDGIAAPADAPDFKTNPTWQLQSYLKDTNAKVRTLLATEAVQSATIDKLVGAVATLAANIGDLDPAAIVAELKAAIESIDVHLDVTSPTA
jgi:hypothetical protein